MCRNEHKNYYLIEKKHTLVLAYFTLKIFAITINKKLSKTFARFFKGKFVWLFLCVIDSEFLC